MVELDDVQVSGVTELLVETLFGVASDDFIVQMVELVNLLESVGYVGHIAALELLALQCHAQEIDNLEITPQVDEIVRESCRRALLECGVTYDPDIDAEMLLELCQAILAFTPTEQPQRLIDALEAGDDDESALLNVLDELTGRSESEWLTVIQNVGYGLIDKIKSLCISALENAAPTTTFIREIDYAYIERLGRLQEQVITRGDSIVDIAPQMESIPSIESLYISRVNQLIDMEPVAAVNELYAMAVLCNSSFESAYADVGEYLDDLYDDTASRMEAEMIRDSLKAKYQSIVGG